MSQDSFNKIVTTILLTYCMALYAVSWYTGKPIDLQGVLILLAPIVTHMGHIVADNRKEVVSIQKNGHGT